MLRSLLQRFFGARPRVESRYVRAEGHPRVVVFVHGLRGDPRETWRNQETGATWPDLLARDPDFAGFDVYLVGHHSAVRRRASTIEEVAQRVLQQLRDHHVFDRDEIYFIGHSMGGVVTKRMLTSLRGPVDAATLSRVRGILYLATPTQGAPLAAISRWLKMSPQVGDLAPNVGSFLQAIENDWEDLLRDRDIQRIQFPRVFSAYETKPFRQAMIVEREWARTRCDANAYPVDLDHMQIVKPADASRDPYPWARERILDVTHLRSDQLLLPAADTNRFSVALTHLANDEGREYEQLIVASLADLSGVEILRFDRTIELEGPRPQEAIAKGHEEGRHLLAASGAQLIVWGRVLRRDGRSVVQLFWTPGGSAHLDRATGVYALEGFELPQDFWGQLVEALRLIVTNEHAQVADREGHFVADQLGALIARTRTLVEKGEPDDVLKRLDTPSMKRLLADALLTFGDQAADNGALAEAIALFRGLLNALSRPQEPVTWATTQHNLGTALVTLGEREAGTARLEEAVAAFRAALTEMTRERVPLDWAVTQSSLGNALLALGERQAGTARLKEAVTAFRAALMERTRERGPFNWAATHNNLGSALATLGGREAGTARLEEAVAAFRAALTEMTRERVPLGWAMTQNNLGNALLRLGEREAGTLRLEDAVAAYRAALTEGSRDRVPLRWATTQNNLGNALCPFGKPA